jgi:hypothetical protein
MSELDDFLTTTLPRQIEAEEAIHNGDVEPRLEMWSRKDPVTLLGAFWGGQERLGRRQRDIPLARVAILELHRV